MSFSLGIVGLPNVGKSTLFNALTKNKAEASNYPFCTIDPNVGVVTVPDDRITQLAELSKSEKIIPTVIEFVDIAGLVKGAAQGEGLGNKFLTHIREVDAIVQVVRDFENKDITHVHGNIDPEHDMDIINTELILADLETVSSRLERCKKQAKGTVPKELQQEIILLEKLNTHLEQSRPARDLDFSKEERNLLRSLNLLTVKPMLYVLNVAETEISTERNLPKDTIRICAKIESELADLSDTERTEYLKELNLSATGLQDLITASYRLLHLITYLTTGPKETKAWTIEQGTKAPQAAGKIHTDFEKGFIRAEVINWQELLTAGGWTAAKESGKVRMEGKEYLFQDGDVVIFHFSS